MNRFRELCDELFRQYGEIDCADLEPIDQRRLAAAYVREHPEAVEGLLDAIRPESIAGHIATLLESPLEDCDVFDLAREIRNAVIADEGLATDLDAELAHQWRIWHAAAAERAADARTEAALAYDEPALLQRQAG